MQIKRIAKKTAIGLSLLIAPFIGIYQAPKQLNGKTRGLTPKETQVAQEIFGSSIDYTKVALHDGIKGVIGAGFVPKAVTLGNDVLYKDIPNPEDEDIEMGVTMHELTHVYQFQNRGIPSQLDIITKSVIAITTEEGGYKSLYTAPDDALTGFNDLNHEQQANFVTSHYYNLDYLKYTADKLLSRQQQEKSKLKSSNDFLEQETIKTYAKLLYDKKIAGDALPLSGVAQVEKVIRSIQFHGENIDLFAETKHILEDKRDAKYIQTAIKDKKRDYTSTF